MAGLTKALGAFQYLASLDKDPVQLAEEREEKLKMEEEKKTAALVAAVVGIGAEGEAIERDQTPEAKRIFELQLLLAKTEKQKDEFFELFSQSESDKASISGELLKTKTKLTALEKKKEKAHENSDQVQLVRDQLAAAEREARERGEEIAILQTQLNEARLSALDEITQERTFAEEKMSELRMKLDAAQQHVQALEGVHAQDYGDDFAQIKQAYDTLEQKEAALQATQHNLEKTLVDLGNLKAQLDLERMNLQQAQEELSNATQERVHWMNKAQQAEEEREGLRKEYDTAAIELRRKLNEAEGKNKFEMGQLRHKLEESEAKYRAELQQVRRDHDAAVQANARAALGQRINTTMPFGRTMPGPAATGIIICLILMLFMGARRAAPPSLSTCRRVMETFGGTVAQAYSGERGLDGASKVRDNIQIQEVKKDPKSNEFTNVQQHARRKGNIAAAQLRGRGGGDRNHNRR